MGSVCSQLNTVNCKGRFDQPRRRDSPRSRQVLTRLVFPQAPSPTMTCQSRRWEDQIPPAPGWTARASSQASPISCGSAGGARGCKVSKGGPQCPCFEALTASCAMVSVTARCRSCVVLYEDQSGACWKRTREAIGGRFSEACAVKETITAWISSVPSTRNASDAHSTALTQHTTASSTAAEFRNKGSSRSLACGCRVSPRRRGVLTAHSSHDRRARLVPAQAWLPET